jgi:murein DD-endopeptidase MepM/ murein hydrolase activator NlpD
VRRRRSLLWAAFAALLVAVPAASAPRGAVPAGELRVTFVSKTLRPGSVGFVLVRPVSPEATVEGAVGDRPLAFFPYADGVAALVGVDLEVPPGRLPWKVAVLESAAPPRTAVGALTVEPRAFSVQRLTLPPGQVDLDPETIGRVEREVAQLRSLYQTITPDRLWRGKFISPVTGAGPGEGFGARRIINGQPRSPHSGADYAAERGTPVIAANAGLVALVGEFFFPGRFVAIDHGRGLYTLYFHLDRALVSEGERVDRGQPIGAVGSTGRATGPHLHFGVQMGLARIDPESLLGLKTD